MTTTLPLSFKPLLAMDYSKVKKKDSYQGWFMSEKLDGIRCIYYNQQLYSRTGNIIHAPTWFLDTISKNCCPLDMLDGELFSKRNDFQNICSIVKKDCPIDEEWNSIKYMIFDAPSLDFKFEERFHILQTHVKENEMIQIVKHTKIQNENEIQDFLNYITIECQGEGVMLRDPNGFYEHKRSNTLLKVKKFDDDEAVIVDVELGKGKYINAIGKLRVRWCSSPSMEFKVGSGLTDLIRNIQDKESLIGKKVKIKYCGTTVAGKPRFPVFLGFYEDNIH